MFALTDRLTPSIKRQVKLWCQRAGYEIIRVREPRADDLLAHDLAREDFDTFLRVRPYTMTSPERIFALIRAVRYVVVANVPGTIVECGVWRGGSMMAVAYTLLHLGAATRELYLFDTFAGMEAPHAELDGQAAVAQWHAETTKTTTGGWFAVPLGTVRANLQQTGYDPKRVHLVPGNVQDTLPAAAPEKIALLRLDTDYYASTKHELEHLFPRLAAGGVLILDDYGLYPGARRATDEYFRPPRVRPLLHRIDQDARIAVKVT